MLLNNYEDNHSIILKDKLFIVYPFFCFINLLNNNCMIVNRVYVFICFFCGLSLVAQDANNLGVKTTMSAFDSPVNVSKSGFWVPNKAIDNTVSGSVYLFDTWFGRYTVVGENQNSTQIFNLNYNLQTKSLESVIGKDSIFQYNMTEIDLVKEGKRTFKVINNVQVSGLLLELFAGADFQIYKETTLSIKKGAFDRLTQTKVAEDKLVQVAVYYVAQNGIFRQEKITKKLILDLVGDKKEAVSKFATKFDLRYSSDSDLSRILIYHSGL
jgi:hypothetical protein